MSLQKFLEENIDYDEMIMDNYKLLNEVNLPSKKKRFPYNVLRLTVEPTYKSISIEHIKGRNFYEKKGGNNKIFICFY
jgi:hypothetical protein